MLHSPAMAFTTTENKKPDTVDVYKGRSYSNSGHTLGYGKKLNSYYCNHCKMPGHSIERCWKVNGYPSFNHSGKYTKNKKIAAVVYGDEEFSESDGKMIPLLVSLKLNMII